MAILVGNKYNNTLQGGNANDTLTGGGGNDLLLGDGGVDTAKYSSALSNYIFGRNGSSLSVQKKTGAEGSDKLIGIEQLQFTDGMVSLGSADIPLTLPGLLQQGNTAFVLLPNGGFALSWTSKKFEGSRLDIYVQRFDSKGNPTSDALLVADTATVAPDTSLAVLDDGSLICWWTRTNGITLTGQKIGVNGQKIGSSFTIGSDNGWSFPLDGDYRSSSVTQLKGGGFVVTWSDKAGSDHINAQIYDGTGNTVGSAFEISTTLPATADNLPVIAALGNGGFVASWSGKTSDQYDIYLQRFDASGAKVGAEIKANTTSYGDQKWSGVTALANDSFVVTWSSYASDGTGYNLQAQRFSASGTKQGKELLVTPAVAGDQYYGSIATLADNSFVISWTSDDGYSAGIYLQRFASNGSKIGAKTLVNTDTFGTQQKSEVKALPDGGFIVTWESNNTAPSSGIYMQKFDASGKPLGLKLTGTTNADQLTVGNQSFMLVDGAGGHDKINGGNSGDRLKGSSGNDTLLGNGGADSLEGDSGNDILKGGTGRDRLNGGTGADTLDGGTDNDVYVVDSGSDKVIELTNGGNDLVLSSASFTLGANVENLMLTRLNAFQETQHINATGNSLANKLTGNGGDNVIDGKGGNDILVGNQDWDTFCFSTTLNASTNVDTILDFDMSYDSIRLDSRIFEKLSPAMALDDENFTSNADGLAGDTNDYIVHQTVSGKLFYDADGNGAGAAVLFAIIGMPAISSFEFEIV